MIERNGNMLLWIILLTGLLPNFVDAGAYHGAVISCACSTTQCLEHGLQRCNTTGLCFSQYLERADGAQPMVRGCIASRTPLLCENRRPAVAGRAWPLLFCCGSDLCNRDAVPTPPPWHRDDNATDSNVQPSVSHVDTSEPTLTKSSNRESVRDSQDLRPVPPVRSKSQTFPHIVSPVYITVLVLGVVSLAAIGVVATVVLRRSSRLFAEHYGALEHHPGCPKHPLGPADDPVVQCDCDSEEVESGVRRSRPFVHVIYDRQPET